MKRRTIITVSLLLIFSLHGLAAADYLRQKFEDMDMDNDAEVTWKEYKYYVPSPQKKDFVEADLNKDDVVELFEWIAWQNNNDPDMARYSYAYKNKSGQLFKYKDGYWYKRQNEFWYQFRNGQWLTYDRADRRLCDRYYDFYRGSMPHYGHDHSRYRYRIGFHYRFGHTH